MSDSFCDLWTVPCQAPLSIGFSHKNTGVGCPFHLQGIFLTQASNPCLLHGQADSLSLSLQGFRGGFRGVLACSMAVGRQCDGKTNSQWRADRQVIHHYFQEGAFQVVLVVKNLPVNAGDIRLMFDPWVRKIPWRRAWQPTPLFLPRESHGQRSLADYIVHRVAQSQTQLK